MQTHETARLTASKLKRWRGRRGGSGSLASGCPPRQCGDVTYKTLWAGVLIRLLPPNKRVGMVGNFVVD